MSHPSPAPSAEPDPQRVRAWLKARSQAVRRWSVAVPFLALADTLCAAGFAFGLASVLQALWPGQKAVVGLDIGLLFLVASPIARAGIGIVNLWLNQKISRRIIHDLRLCLMEKWLDGRGEIDGKTTALFEMSEALEGYYACFVPARVASGLSPLVAVAIAALASPVCALILLFTLLPFVALMGVAGLATAAESRRQIDALTRLSVLFADRIRALPLILAYDAAPAQTVVVGRAASAVSERTLKVLRMAFSGAAVLEFFAALSVALVAVYCGFALLHLLPFPVPAVLDFRGPSAFAAAFFALALAPEVYAPLRQLSAAYHERQAAEAAAQPLMIIEDRLSGPVRNPVTPTTAPEVRFDNVVCRFADDADFTIGPVSFAATPGRITVIAGDSGSGKSTLLRTLLGGRHDGAITIDGRPLTSADDLGPSLAWVSQHTPILAGTLRDNLRLADPTADDARLIAAAERAGLSDLLTVRGLDASLNERGSGLSGGERRRIGLARALVKDVPLLVLDEPTADLDATTEAAIIAVIADCRDRTVILATHSDKLMAIADQVVRL